MPNWAIALLSAAVILLLRELFEWWRRPNLKIDFEEDNNGKPCIQVANDYIRAAIGPSKAVYRIKHLRLKVENKGRQVAHNCEAKLELTINNELSFQATIHWSRRDCLLYTTGLETLNPVTDFEKAYAPIDINRNDVEYVEVLRMHFWYSTQPNKDMPGDLRPELTSASVPALALSVAPDPDIEYQLKVTVYSNNAAPASKSFKIEWDGTVKGFNSDVIK